MRSKQLTVLNDKLDQLDTAISEFPFLSLIKSEIQNLKNELQRKEVIIPLVGEFSSGKTSLMNALIGKKILPVDITPTTFVVNEVRFSSEMDKIEITFKNGTKKIYDELFDLSTINYSNASIVKVYVSNNTVPGNIVLVDLPGLSSEISRHDEVTLEYLPKAHCIFVIVDINQGALTKSLLDFLHRAKIIDLPLYLVLTKSDLKSSIEIENIVDYFIKNVEIEFKKIIVTSAKSNQLKELMDLLSFISIDSDRYLFEGLNKKISYICSGIVKQLQEHLDDLNLDLPEINKKIQEEKAIIKRNQMEMNKILDEINNKIREIKDKTIDKFEQDLLTHVDRLTNLAFKGDYHFEEEFKDVVKNVSERALEFFRRTLQVELREQIQLIQSNTFSTGISNISGISTYNTYIANIVNFIAYTLILDFIIPGGLLYAFIAKIALEIFVKSEKIKIIDNIIKEISGKIAKLFTKKYVKDKITEAMRNIVDQFRAYLEENCEIITREMHLKVSDEFSKVIKDHENNYRQLIQQKESKKEQLELYKKNIEATIEKVKNLCKEYRSNDRKS